MGNINYNQWITGNDCCKNNCDGDCNCHKDVCDCENILLEISKLHTDDEILQDEIDELSGKVEVISATVDTKLDASAYTPVDLTDYATKQWVEDKHYLTTVEPLKTINGESLIGEGNIVISGGSGSTITVDDHLDSASTNPVQNKVITEVLNSKLDASAYTPTDLSNYYTKEQVDALIEASQPSLSGYVTNATFIQYISNLQEQINSLTAEISGCCGSSGETQYRWITETGENDYWCSGTTKMTMEKQQSSNDGINWTDTGSERSGSTVLETNCADCGYVPVYGMKLTSHYNNGNTKVVMCNGEFEDCYIDKPDFAVYETGASGLTSAEIGECPTIIAGYAFSGCTSLSAITIPDNVTRIGAWSFLDCVSLTSITLPSGTTAINQNAFQSCFSLTSVTCLAITPPALSNATFKKNGGCAIYVPAASVDAYKTARFWSEYADYIYPIT